MLGIKVIRKAGNRRRDLKVMDLLEQIQRRFAKITKGLEHLSYECRLRVAFVQSGGQKALGRPYCKLSILKGRLYESWGQTY